jgi:multicomponent Na+:H+ antiporter subunit E
MRRCIYFGVALVTWLLITWPIVGGKLDVQVLVAGIVAALLVSVLFHEILPREHRLFISPVRIFWFLVFVPVFFFYVIKANLDVVYRALHPQMPIRPGIVKVHTRLRSASGITALANAITLTPGTLTVDLTDDGALYVHWIYVRATEPEAATQHIVTRFEWFLKRVFE